MKVTVNSITGIDDAICSMYISRGSLTEDLEEEIRDIVGKVNSSSGCFNDSKDSPLCTLYVDWMDKLCKFGIRHITLLRYIDFSVSVRGLHRGGQDDWDAHAQRFNNRIIRNSSRIANIKDKSGLESFSDFYKGKILTTEQALESVGIELPEKIEKDGKTYVRTYNGYVLESEATNQDVLRGLYPLGYSSNFSFRCNLTEFSHVYKERGKHGGANPEVKELAEAIADQLEKMQPWFNRQLLMAIKN